MRFSKSLKSAWATKYITGQPGLHCKTVSSNNNNNRHTHPKSIFSSNHYYNTKVLCTYNKNYITSIIREEWCFKWEWNFPVI